MEVGNIDPREDQVVEHVPFLRAVAVLRDGADRWLTHHADDLLGSHAKADLVGVLDVDIARLLAPATVEAFQRRVELPSRWSRTGYRAFSDRLADGELLAIVARSPFLERALPATIDDWKHLVNALLAALRARRAGDDLDAPAVPIEAVRRAGRSGFIVTTVDGRRLVFKARDMTIDAAFQEIVAWANEILPRAARVEAPIRCGRTEIGAHGWTPLLDSPPEPDRESFRQVGVLLGIQTVLGGGDMHRGNVKLVGNSPVVIDAEKTIRPVFPFERDDLWTPSPASLVGWMPNAIGISPATCGLQSLVAQESRVGWIDVGTDAVRISQPATIDHDRRVLLRTLEAHAPDIRAGMELALRAVASELPVDRLQGTQCRVMVRHFACYHRTHRALALTTTEEEVETIRRGLRAERSPADTFAASDGIQNLEWTSLLANRLPLFTCRADGTALRFHHRAGTTADHEWSGAFAASPIEKARRLHRELTPSRISDQIRVIDDALDHLRVGAAEELDRVRRAASSAPVRGVA